MLNTNYFFRTIQYILRILIEVTNHVMISKSLSTRDGCTETLKILKSHIHHFKSFACEGIKILRH